MDEKTEIASTNENEGPSCAIDKSCCGGVSANEIVDAGCTLNPAEMPERLGRWQVLFGQMLGYDRRPDHAVFRFLQSAELDAELQDLVKLEQVCCAHVSWDVRVEGNEVLLTLTAEQEVLGVLVRSLSDEFVVGA
ncbi:hypothetical protein QMT40_002899 [Parvibaculaceae bacterium PLY_AMNH_Bact1]|nr:hypothetical protein QMT40_002899 [Parvibaculaceae bacterium PLY_AMNH_Bact1]